MRFTFDPEKKRSNPKNHPGITFEMAEEVFNDPGQVMVDSYYIAEDGEQRYQIIGLSGMLVLLLVVFVDRSINGDEVIHLISARKANDYEEAIYAEANH